MFFIPDNDTLVKYIPNTIISVDGEVTLFDKMHSSLSYYEQYILREWCEAALIENTLAWDYACQYVALRAFADRFDMFNVVLTPNGFGVVSNQNIAPASRDRMSDLRDSCIRQCVMALDGLYNTLIRMPEWHNSKQSFWQMVSVNGPQAVLLVKNRLGILAWEQVRSMLANVDREIADKALGTDIMRALQTHSFMKIDDPKTVQCYFNLRDEVSAFEIKNITGNSADTHGRLLKLVKYIRDHIDVFPEWSDTPQATYWQSVHFENKKEYGGYWF